MTKIELNVLDFRMCNRFCTRRSWWVRRTKGPSAAMASIVLNDLAAGVEDEDRLASEVAMWVEKEYPRNPILVYILLHIVLPILIKLILEWWQNRTREVR